MAGLGEVGGRGIAAVAAAQDRDFHGHTVHRERAGHTKRRQQGETTCRLAMADPHERTLGAITLVRSASSAWLLMIVGSVGIALVYLLLAFLFYLFAHSALITWLRGNGVLLSSQQLPDLRERFDACCAKLGLEQDKPEAYLLQGGGTLNAFATRFLGRHYVVLLSDVVDAMQADPEGVNFYLGHELGHVRMHHLTGKLLALPVLWLPLLGAAYSRAKEYTCDRHGRACCESARDGGARAGRRSPRARSAGARSTCRRTRRRRP